MKDFCTILGELLIAVAMFATPILFTCSVVFNWNVFVKALLTILCSADIATIWLLVMSECFKED